MTVPWKNSTCVKCRLNKPSNSKSGSFLRCSKNKMRHFGSVKSALRRRPTGCVLFYAHTYFNSPAHCHLVCVKWINNIFGWDETRGGHVCRPRISSLPDRYFRTAAHCHLVCVNCDAENKTYVDWEFTCSWWPVRRRHLLDLCAESQTWSWTPIRRWCDHTERYVYRQPGNQH